MAIGVSEPGRVVVGDGRAGAAMAIGVSEPGRVVVGRRHGDRRRRLEGWLGAKFEAAGGGWAQVSGQHERVGDAQCEIYK